MDYFASTVADAALSRLFDWGKIKVSNRKKQMDICQLIDETATRASMMSTSVDLCAKFRNLPLVEELLAHRGLLDIGKSEAIDIFLGDGADDAAYGFVENFWDSVNTIMSTGDESLADRKAIERIEAIDCKIDHLLETSSAISDDWNSQKKALINYCNLLAQCCTEFAIPRRIEFCESRSIVSQSDFVRNDQSLLIYADPGMGKSELMRFIAAHLAKDWIAGNGSRIPIFIDARGWSRRYSNLIEGAAVEIFGQVTELSVSFVRRNLALFCLIVDGLDEARGNRDLFFTELSHYAKCEGTRLICSSRFEKDCLRIGIDKGALLSLSDEEAIAYLGDKGIDSPWRMMHRFNEAGRELMHNPLHLNCLAEYLLEKGTEDIPRNLAIIYRACINAMIESNIDPNDDIDADYLQQRLGSYALECLINQSVVPCKSFLIERFDSNEAERVEKAGKASGLLNAKDGIVGFSHAVLQEYLAAFFLANQEGAVIDAFCQRYSRDALLKNYFEILCGCAADASKQALILDCLEENNLALFMDCLHGRMNLSDEMEKSLDRDDVESIVRQALETYMKISNRYLAKMKPYIPFWQTLSKPDARIRIEADYSAATTVIHIVLKERHLGEELVHVSFSDDRQGPMITSANGIVAPIISMRMSSQPEVHVYRIATLYGGVDCAREIAISMINDDLKGFFESAATIPSEPIGMRVGFIEEALRRCRVKCEDNDGRRRPLSLRWCTADELARLLDGTPDNIINVDGTHIPTSLLPILMKMLELEPENHFQYLMPEPDNLCEGCRKIWEIYTDESFKAWCAIALLECEKSYRQFVRTFMEEIGEYLPAYADGPFALQVAIMPADNSEVISDRRLHVFWHPIEREEDARIEFVDGRFLEGFDLNGFNERSQHYIRAARLLGRPGGGYHESDMLGSILLRGPHYMHKEVRARIQKDVEKLFNLH